MKFSYAKTICTAVIMAISYTAAAATVTPPSELQAMQLLYGPSYTKPGSIVNTVDKFGMKFNKPANYDHRITEYVVPWKQQLVHIDGAEYFIAFGQGHSAANGGTSHVQPAYVSAIWFQHDKSGWKVAGKSQNIAAGGSFGQETGQPWSIFPHIFYSKGSVILMSDENGYGNQGYFVYNSPVFTFSPKNGVESMGGIFLGASDSNAVANQSDATSFEGEVVSAIMSNDGKPMFSISFTGKTYINSKPVVLKNKVCKYVFETNKYGPDFQPVSSECKEIKKSGVF